MTVHIDVRPARADDKSAILAFCQDTFSWGDYIPNVWDKWLGNAGGQILVGVVDQQPVGLLRVAFLEDGSAWLEGMRVHPDFRRQGIGTAIDQSACSLARERGRRVVRLATSIKNVPAQKTLATEGYFCVARFNDWETEPARREFSTARVATPEDAPGLMEVWRASAAHAASGLLPDRDWHWHELTQPCLLEQINAGEVRTADGGFASLLAFDEKDWSGISVHALAGDEAAMFTLALAARGEAQYRGYSHVETRLIDQPALNAALERAGYRCTGGMYIYEQVLE